MSKPLFFTILHGTGPFRVSQPATYGARQATYLDTLTDGALAKHHTPTGTVPGIASGIAWHSLAGLGQLAIAPHPIVNIRKNPRRLCGLCFDVMRFVHSEVFAIPI